MTVEELRDELDAIVEVGGGKKNVIIHIPVWDGSYLERTDDHDISYVAGNGHDDCEISIECR